MTKASFYTLVFTYIQERNVFKANDIQMPIQLHFRLKKLKGRLVLHLPNPPSDRIWYDCLLFSEYCSCIL